MFKEFFNKKTNKKQRANMWTFSRLVTSFLIPICSLISILTSNFSLFITSICVTGFAAATDFFDGRSARKYNSFSEYGKLLDQLSDKIFSIMVGINLVLYNPMFLMTLLGEGIIAGINISYRLKYKDLNMKSTQIGRIKQWPLSVALILGFISSLVPSLSLLTKIMVLLTFMFQTATSASYIVYNNNEIKKLKENKDLFNLENDIEKETEKAKTKDSKENVVIKSKKTITTKEQCENLRKLRDELTYSDKINNLKKDGFQKTKK